MLLIVRVQVDFAKRHRERTGSYPAGALRGNLAFEGHISTRTLIRRLHHQGMRARRPIKRPQLTLRHRHARIDWSHDRLGWTIRQERTNPTYSQMKNNPRQLHPHPQNVVLK
jgi:hypothetical protein